MWIVRLALRRPYTFVVMAIGDHSPGIVRHLQDADRHLSGSRYPGHLGRLAVPGHDAIGDGRAHRPHIRRHSDHDGQRHRAYREPVALWRGRGPHLFPARREDRRGRGAGGGDFTDRRCADAAGHSAAADAAVQRVHACRSSSCRWAAIRFPSSSSSTLPTTSCATTWPPCRAQCCPGPMAASSGRSWWTSSPTSCSASGCRPLTFPTPSTIRT